jgi:polysaccharide pyruvyl transferase WcaK-like protein
MTKATLVGYHGRRNLGDDIFFRVACRWLEQRSGADTIFVAGLKGSVPTRLPDCAARIAPFERPKAWFARSVWLRTFVRAVRSMHLVFAAGSIFTIQPFLLAYVLVRALRVLNPNIQIIALGVSIGPFRSAFDEKWCAKLMSLFDVIALRDTESLQTAARIGVQATTVLSYDLALCWPAALAAPKHAREASVLGVCINEKTYLARSTHSPSTAAGETLLSALRIACEENPALKIRLLVVCSDDSDGDRKVTEELAMGLERAGIAHEIAIYDGTDPDTYMEALTTCGGIISSRMHTGVLAMMQSVPILQIAYAPKIPAFYEHCGLDPANLIRMDRLVVEDVVGFVESIQLGTEVSRAHDRRRRLLDCAAKLRADMESISTETGA